VLSVYFVIVKMSEGEENAIESRDWSDNNLEHKPSPKIRLRQSWKWHNTCSRVVEPREQDLQFSRSTKCLEPSRANSMFIAVSKSTISVLSLMLIRGPQIVQESSSFQIIGARRMPRNKVHTEDLKFWSDAWTSMLSVAVCSVHVNCNNGAMNIRLSCRKCRRPQLVNCCWCCWWWGRDVQNAWFWPADVPIARSPWELFAMKRNVLEII
jgi:hypothetical protein